MKLWYSGGGSNRVCCCIGGGGGGGGLKVKQQEFSERAPACPSPLALSSVRVGITEL